MTDSPQTLLYVFVSAMIIENLVFARAVGVDDVIERTRTYRRILQFGSVMAVTTTLSSLFIWVFKSFLEETPYWVLLRAPATVFCLAASFILVWLILHSFRPRKKSFDLIVISASFNGASLGTILLAFANYQRLLQIIVYGLGCSAGLIIAMFLIHSGRERLEISNVSKSFSGLPITLIYIGILSLAVYGLIGHQLPT